MSFESDLYSWLAADTTLSGLVGTRIYPHRRAQAATLPYLVWDRISAVHEETYGRSIAGTHPRVQFTAWSDDPDEPRTIITALKSRLLTMDGTSSVVQDVQFDDNPDLDDEETRSFGAGIDAVFVLRGIA